MRILIVEPYYGGSHKAWVDGYQRFSSHDVEVLSLPAQFWKWRMQGGAITIARLLEAQYKPPDLILVTDMLNVATLRALLRNTCFDACPILLYFHESQFSYPQNRRQNHGWQYAFINYASALAADGVFFNSIYHFDTFFDELPRMLKHFADYNERHTVDLIRSKSHVLPLGIDLRKLDSHRPKRSGGGDIRPSTILWNHRWEEEKNPQSFFKSLETLIDMQIDFRVAITGENNRQNPAEFEAARNLLGQRLVHLGYVASEAAYARLLWQADIVVSTAYQEFFGGAVAEAIYCGCIPVLPNRLNYPNLIPQAMHRACLYKDRGQALTYRLAEILTGQLSVDRQQLREFIAQYDWQHLAPVYDQTLAAFA